MACGTFAETTRNVTGISTNESTVAGMFSTTSVGTWFCGATLIVSSAVPMLLVEPLSTTVYSTVRVSVEGLLLLFW